MKSKCYSVRLKSLVQISSKCFKATAYDGSNALIPLSQIYGIDFTVSKADAYWISAWILEQKNLQYSDKKIGWFNPDTGEVNPHVIIEHHKPIKIEVKQNDPDNSLIR